MPDEDDLADKYVLADERARRPPGWSGTRSRTGRRDDGEPVPAQPRSTGPARDWWGVGPGAHSHVGGVRWWNVKHPAAYAERLGAGRSPAQAREVLDAETRRVERVLLELRLRDGLPGRRPRRGGSSRGARTWSTRGLLVRERGRPAGARPARGRLLADAVVRDLLP